MKTKFLGQTINENLSWNKYINYVVCKTSSGLSTLLQISQICNLVISRIIFHSLMQSQKSYGLCIYGAISEEKLDKICSKQKPRVQIMREMKKTESV